MRDWIFEIIQGIVALAIIASLVILAKSGIDIDGLDTALTVIVAVYFGRTSSTITLANSKRQAAPPTGTQSSYGPTDRLPQ